MRLSLVSSKSSALPSTPRSLVVDKNERIFLAFDTIVVDRVKQLVLTCSARCFFTASSIQSKIMPLEPQLLSGLGAASAIFLTATGSAIASAEGGIFALRNNKTWMAFIPIVQAGVLAIYGIIISILLVGKMDSSTDDMSPSEGYRHLSAGLSVGFACCASGYGMAKFLKHCNSGGTPTVEKNAPNSGNTEQTQPLIESSTRPSKEVDFKRLIMVLIFMESIGLYGLIAALFLIGKN